MNAGAASTPECNRGSDADPARAPLQATFLTGKVIFFVMQLAIIQHLLVLLFFFFFFFFCINVTLLNIHNIIAAKGGSAIRIAFFLALFK